MKLKKLTTGILLLMILLLQFSFVQASNLYTNENQKDTKAGNGIINAIFSVSTQNDNSVGATNNEETKVKSFEIAITPVNTTDLKALEPGSEFEVDVEMKNLKNIEEGLISLTGQLEYDTNILEKIELRGRNNWKFGANGFNEKNFKFVLDNDGIVKQSGAVFKIKFKVKEGVARGTKTTIKVKGVSASGGNGLIVANDVQAEIAVKMPEPPRFTSKKYVINDTDKDISRITPNTTVAQFKSNVNTNQNLVFTDGEGNILNNESVLGTGMTLKVGEIAQYTLVVIGDIDRDKEISVVDLAKIKLHLIENTKLRGIELKAGDLDNDSNITINDVAQMKLVIIGLFEIK